MERKYNHTDNYDRKADGVLKVQRHMFVRLSECIKKQKVVIRLIRRFLAVFFTSLLFALILTVSLVKCGRRQKGVLAIATAISTAVMFASAASAAHAAKILNSLGSDIRWLEEEIEQLEDR